MVDKLTKKNTINVFAQEENLLDWNEVLKNFQKTFGSDVYESWIKNINLKKEFNDYIILSAPTRFVRDWIVSRYADKILVIIKTFKESIQRIEFLIEELDEKFDKEKSAKNINISSIKNSLLNYNRFNLTNSFDNFIDGDE